MKLLDFFQMKSVRRSVAGGVVMIILAVLLLETNSVIQFYFARKGLVQEAKLRAESELETTKLEINNIIADAEAAVRNNAWLAKLALNHPDSIASVSRLILTNNPAVMGSTMALVPGYLRRRPLYAPYVYRPMGVDTLMYRSLATEEYDYPNQDWFSEPLETGEGYWSEPYMDEGGGDALMTTYSLPIRDRKGRIAAVLTADISLDWLTGIVGDVKLYPHSFSVLLSREGNIMVSPVETLTIKTNALDLVPEMDDSLSYVELTQDMMDGKSGKTVVRRRGEKQVVYFAPVERTGWSMSVVIPESEIFSNIRQVKWMVIFLHILGIGMLLVILAVTIRNLLKYNNIAAKKDRMESELRIGHNIQMSMVPLRAPECSEVDISATIVPAKEVGGDLYDFYIRDNKLFFCIGDVSGKGVPASLVMAVTRTLFRSISAREESPGAIVSAMNSSMTDMNDNNMFVTFFCGVLDLVTGHLRYCNAGHNAPLFFSDSIEKLPVEPNLALGVLSDMVFKEQSLDIHYDDALFLYTDGVTEAENAFHELFGEDRLLECLRKRGTSQEHLEAVIQSVNTYVGAAPQSDDMTMLFIRCTNEALLAERSLTLQNDIAQIPLLADFIGEAAAAWGLRSDHTQAVNLALEEALTNVMMYAYPKGETGSISLKAVKHPDRIDFILSDAGRPFDPTAAEEPDVTLPVEQRPIGGLGIFLVKKIMDSVSYCRTAGENILTMTKII